MCGIAGVISTDPAALPLIKGMTDLLRHRGPDDEGYLFAGKDTVTLSGPDTAAAALSSATPFRPTTAIDGARVPAGGWVALGHRRLSILDLSPLGHQPMSYQDRYWIVYNGEIYNYLELREELAQAGCRFLSRSDTEVILAAYAHWGVNCLSRLNGMFAFALLDRARSELLLVRDRFGVKPLYWWQTNRLFAFASEIKAFTCLPGWLARCNGQAAHDYLRSGLQDHSSETLFRDVQQLDPGSYLKLDRSDWIAPGASDRRRPQSQRWYQLRGTHFPGTFDQASSQFQDLLTDAVRLRLRSDVSVGSCLSGGLDSSSIVCVANRLLQPSQAAAAQKTFSACAELERFDERRYIREVVAATRVEPHYVFPSLETLFQDLDRLIWHQDEPFGSTSIFAQWSVFRLARQEQTRVMLDGQGADELLYGYSNFRRAFVAGLVRSGHWNLAWREARALRGSSSKALSMFLRGATDAATPVRVQKHFRQTRKNRQTPAWLCPNRLEATFPGRLANPFQSHTTAQELSLEQVSGGHLPMLLHWEDRNSMAHSVEARLPFLDYRLAEFAVGLPDHFKIRRGLTKAVLRQGMRGLVPQAILDRTDKMGFVTPEEVWAREQGTEQFHRALADAVSVSAGVLTEAGLKQFEQVVAGQRPYDWSIWRMICFGRWVRRFGVSI